MWTRTVSILGVPVDNLDSIETVNRILALIELYRKEHPRQDITATTGSTTQYVSTLNVDFIANAQGFGITHVNNPELLDILRKSDIVTPDGMPVIWLSALLGSKIKERVAGVDLIVALVKALALQNRSIFLLGGTEEVAQEAADQLQTDNPGLQVVGLACPQVHIDGEALVEAPQRDQLLIEEINKAAPDVLFISLGHPKQEIWFERVRHKLLVPIAIGVGGSFDILTNRLQRAPKWMQKYGLEWMYRLTQEPARLFGRYLKDALCFGYLAIPLVIYDRLNRFFAWVGASKNSKKLETSLLFLSPTKSIATIPLPERITSENCKEVSDHMEEAFAQDVLILDARKTNYIDINGIALLVRGWYRAKAAKKEFYGFGVKRRLSILLALHKVRDVFSKEIVSTSTDLTNRLLHHGHMPTLYDCVYQQGNTVVVSFFGKLDYNQNYEEYLNKFVTTIHEKDCLIDFSYCTFIDNSGFSFLLQFKQLVESGGKKLQITEVSKQLWHLFRLAGVNSLFQRVKNQ